MKGGFTYITTNKHHTVLYTGVSGNLENRVAQHKTKFYLKSFTAKYNADKLVYYETFWDIRDAIAREKQIKAGSRRKKIALIEKMNPAWDDLTDKIK